MSDTYTPPKAIKTIALSGTGISGRLLSATVFKGREVEVDEIAGFQDTEYTTIPRPVAKFTPFKFVLLDDAGSDAAALAALAGTVVTVTVTATPWDGKTTGTARTIACDMAISSAAPGGEVEVDGSRRATVEITATPHCPAAGSNS